MTDSGAERRAATLDSEKCKKKEKEKRKEGRREKI